MTVRSSRNLRNLIAYAGHHGARYLFPLIVTPFLAKMLGTGQFAELVIWNSSVWSCSIIIEFGFYMFAVTETARANTEEELNSVLSTVVTAKLMLLPVALLFYFAAAHYLGLLERVPVGTIFGGLAVAAYGASFAWYFQGKQRGFTAVLAEAMPQVLQCALVLAFVRGPGDLGKAISFQVIAAICPVVISFLIIRRERQFSLSRVTAAFRSMMQSFPYFLERFCFTAYSAATPLMLAALSTHQQAGYYGISDKVNAFLTGLSTPATQLMLPIVARRIAGSGGWSLSLKLVAALTLVTAAVAAALFIALDPLIHWFFGPSYAPAVAVARWFCVASVLMAYQTAIANFIIIPSGRARLMASASVCALFINFAAQFLLVPHFGAGGSAMARTAAEASVALIFTIVIASLAFKDRQAWWPNRNKLATIQAEDEVVAIVTASLERPNPEEYC